MRMVVRVATHAMHISMLNAPSAHCPRNFRPKWPFACPNQGFQPSALHFLQLLSVLPCQVSAVPSHLHVKDGASKSRMAFTTVCMHRQMWRADCWDSAQLPIDQNTQLAATLVLKGGHRMAKKNVHKTGVGPDALRRICSLIITHQCNLNCRYCYESFKSNKSMAIDLAKEIVEREFATAGDYEGVVIEFMGGEPMIQFDLLREIAEWIWANPWPKPYVFSTSTNGTLFTVESKSWFHQHASRFSVGLSLDGTPAMQETNRGCSFRDIDLDFFRVNWPEQGVKMTVSCETLTSLASGIIHLQERGFTVHANLGYGMPWSDSHHEEFSRQLRILGEYYLQHPDMPRVLLMDLKLEMVLDDTHPVQNFCGTGTHMHIYDVDGTLYPCHMFTPLVMSQAQCDLARKLDFTNSEKLVDPKCWKCSGRDLCPTCYGFNFKLSGDPAIRDLALCKLFKVQLLENCRFQAARLRSKNGSFSREDTRMAKAILRIHDSLAS